VPGPVGIGVATVATTIHLACRYRPPKFDADAPAAFSDRFLDVVADTVA